MNIRQEKPSDYKAVEAMIRRAFENSDLGYHGEADLVAELRKNKTFIPELSIVAELYGEVVGHILLSKIKIEGEHKFVDSLSLAPMSVDPSVQSNGIGALLIEEAHQIAKNLGHKSIFLIGHEDYYPRFGYQKASKFGVEFPFEAPDQNCLVFELVDGGLNNVEGMVKYPDFFFELLGS